MINLVFSIAVGIGGGAFQIRGDDIVGGSYGPKIEVFCDMEIIPGLTYSIGLSGGIADASTRSFAYVYIEEEDTTELVPISGVFGERFEFIQGNLSLLWFPVSYRLKPYLSGRIGLVYWRFTGDGKVVRSLTRNEFERISLSLGSGIGLSYEFSNFVLYIGVLSDFIFSVDNDWEGGFGVADDNEYTVGVQVKIARRF